MEENYNQDNYQYQQPVYSQSVNDDPNKSVMTFGDWIVTLILGMIPCVGFIMLLVWAFGNGNENRKNYARALLIIQIVLAVLSVICVAVFGAAIFAGLSSSGYYY